MSMNTKSIDMRRVLGSHLQQYGGTREQLHCRGWSWGVPFPSFVNVDIDCHGAPHLDYKGSAGFKGENVHTFTFT